MNNNVYLDNPKITNQFLYIPEILTDIRRQQSIHDCEPLLLTGQQLAEYCGLSRAAPGRQTLTELHHNDLYADIFETMLHTIKKYLKQDLSIDRAWINWTDGDKQHECWHTHTPAKLSAVYYMTPYNCGTQFQDQFVETELNSLLVFPSHLLHTAPVAIQQNKYNRYDRYTMAFDLI